MHAVMSNYPLGLPNLGARSPPFTARPGPTGPLRINTNNSNTLTQSDLFQLAQSNVEQDVETSVLGEVSKKLFLGGLRFTETEESVQKHFETFGEVESVQIPKDKVTGKPRGFGFVTFKEENIAVKLASSEGHELNGRLIDLKIAVPKQGSEISTNDIKDMNEVLHKRESNKTVEEHETQDGIEHGERKIKLFRTTLTQKNSSEDSENESDTEPKAVKFDVDDQNFVPVTHVEVEIEPKPAPAVFDNNEDTVSEPKEQTGNRIFIGGLPDGATNSILKDYFSRFGTVLDSFVLLNPFTRRPRGFGFVSFKDREVVPKVLAFANHVILGKRVETRLATRRSSKTAAIKQNTLLSNNNVVPVNFAYNDFNNLNNNNNIHTVNQLNNFGYLQPQNSFSSINSLSNLNNLNNLNTDTSGSFYWNNPITTTTGTTVTTTATPPYRRNLSNLSNMSYLDNFAQFYNFSNMQNMNNMSFYGFTNNNNNNNNNNNLSQFQTSNYNNNNIEINNNNNNMNEINNNNNNEISQ